MKYLFLVVSIISSVCFADPLENTSRKELVNPKTNGKIWVYLPADYGKKSLPVILVPPAGTRLFHGMSLSSGDIPEHTPYVKEGFAVISFDLSGSWPADETDQNIFMAINNFVSRNGGVDDAKEALSIAKSKYPNLDLNEVYIAGHSSAATVSLMAAQQIPEIKGAIAYAPIIDLESYLADIASQVTPIIPEFKKVLIDRSPHKNLGMYRVPVFLFVAKDDEHMSDQKNSYIKFIKALRNRNVQLTFKQANRGGHYQSMIDEGIPSAISWLKTLKISNEK
ncbi:alpha/beta hydrolase family protein [Microbulbifer sp. EKSA008]|uniref:alpha/beta hydrolase family protein n=1 Tax=Microbulbifer sp. EKSA008 TaxID=3243367 RepID=UPI0040411BCE